MHYAAEKGDDAFVTYLLEKDTDINAADMFDWTSLHGAAFYGHRQAVLLLLEKGARIDAVTEGKRMSLELVQDEYKRSDRCYPPERYTCFEEVMDVLKTYGARPVKGVHTAC